MGKHLRRLLLLVAVGTLDSFAWAAGAAPKTICTITINSADERETLARNLPANGYRIVELVQHDRQDWLGAACSSGVRCDAMVISGHFDDGEEFYSDSFEPRGFLTMHQMQRASCSASCDGLFAQLKEVYLFGCNTLKTTARNVASAQVQRALIGAGRSPDDARRVSAMLNERYGESNRDRMRVVFKNVPVLYGFSSRAPLGRSAGPLLERYFSSAPAGEIGSGKPSPTLLSLFGPSSMTAVTGLSDGDPQAALRGDLCSLADESPSTSRKLAFLHSVLRRDTHDVSMLLDHVERFATSIAPGERAQPDVSAALARIAQDSDARLRYLAFARDSDEAPLQARLFALARQLDWLTPAQHEQEMLAMLGERMTRGTLGRHEVDLVCANRDDHPPTIATRLLESGAARLDHPPHAAVLACLGDRQAHHLAIGALTSDDDDAVAVAQTYLRHRPLSDAGELRALAAGIGRMAPGAAQLRALEALARQPGIDAQGLSEITRLFPMTRSLDTQRAIAGVLLRAQHQSLAPAALSRMLSKYRLKSPDGQDIIDLLIRLLERHASAEQRG